jgi:hypothetical protein
MPDEAFVGGVCLGLLVAFFFFAMLSFMADLGMRESFQEEAVQHNAAEWFVTDDGARGFRWKGSEVRDGK